MDDQDVDSLFRQIQRVRNTERAIADRDRHADQQLRYRQSLERKGAPSRADIAVVTLGVLLLFLKLHPDSKKVQTLRKAVENELNLAGFDRDQVRIRLDRMIDKCDDDLKKWREGRAWFKDNKERKKRIKGQ